MGKRFTKTVEDFVCASCGAAVTGSGYTNHCPHCLWSRHVDIYPGDRQSPCGGMMEPVAFVVSGSDCIIEQKCTECGHVHKNRMRPGDDIQALIELSRRGRL